MLTLNKNVTITGTCSIDGETIENYRASINSDDPRIPNITNVALNKELVLANITICREDRAAFEDFVYNLYAEMTADQSEENDSADDTE